MADPSFRVAIIGGGLCGIALAIALSQRGIPFTIYEARASFREIGAGINLGPNSIHAAALLDPALPDAIRKLVTPRPPGKEHLWMTVRLGAPTPHFDDGHLVTDIYAAPTGNMAVGRNELLQLLATRIDPANARFNKKLVDLRQSDKEVTLVFEDGSTSTASVVVGCDGAHSAVRRLMLGRNHPAANPRYSETGVYRAVVDMAEHERRVGPDIARNSTLMAGPRGYLIMYPIEGGKSVNVGFWRWERGVWPHDAWVLPQRKTQLKADFHDWGPLAQRVLEAVGDDVQFWATHHYAVAPESYVDRRVLVIGDASHAMGPHQGQGAAQAMEDACVLAEVLDGIDAEASSRQRNKEIRAALGAYEAVRRPRFERVLETSHEAFTFWTGLWRPDLTPDDLKRLQAEAVERFHWLWNVDLAAEAERARIDMQQRLHKSNEVNGWAGREPPVHGNL